MHTAYLLCCDSFLTIICEYVIGHIINISFKTSKKALNSTVLCSEFTDLSGLFVNTEDETYNSVTKCWYKHTVAGP